MNIACPECQASYDIDLPPLDDHGIDLKCAVCLNTFRVRKKLALSAPNPVPSYLAEEFPASLPDSIPDSGDEEGFEPHPTVTLDEYLDEEVLENGELDLSPDEDEFIAPFSGLDEDMDPEPVSGSLPSLDEQELEEAAQHAQSLTDDIPEESDIESPEELSTETPEPDMWAEAFAGQAPETPPATDEPSKEEEIIDPDMWAEAFADQAAQETEWQAGESPDAVAEETSGTAIEESSELDEQEPEEVPEENAANTEKDDLQDPAMWAEAFVEQTAEAEVELDEPSDDESASDQEIGNGPPAEDDIPDMSNGPASEGDLPDMGNGPPSGDKLPDMGNGPASEGDLPEMGNGPPSEGDFPDPDDIADELIQEDEEEEPSWEDAFEDQEKQEADWMALEEEREKIEAQRKELKKESTQAQWKSLEEQRQQLEAERQKLAGKEKEADEHQETVAEEPVAAAPEEMDAEETVMNVMDEILGTDDDEAEPVYAESQTEEEAPKEPETVAEEVFEEAEEEEVTDVAEMLRQEAELNEEQEEPVAASQEEDSRDPGLWSEEYEDSPTEEPVEAQAETEPEEAPENQPITVGTDEPDEFTASFFGDGGADTIETAAESSDEWVSSVETEGEELSKEEMWDQEMPGVAGDEDDMMAPAAASMDPFSDIAYDEGEGEYDEDGEPVVFGSESEDEYDDSAYDDYDDYDEEEYDFAPAGRKIGPFTIPYGTKGNMIIASAVLGLLLIVGSGYFLMKTFTPDELVDMMVAKKDAPEDLTPHEGETTSEANKLLEESNEESADIEKLLSDSETGGESTKETVTTPKEDLLETPTNAEKLLEPSEDNELLKELEGSKILQTAKEETEESIAKEEKLAELLDPTASIVRFNTIMPVAYNPTDIRVLSFSLEVELNAPETADVVRNAFPVYEKIMVSTVESFFQRRFYNEVLFAKEKLRKKLKKEFEKYIENGEIKKTNFTEFAIQ